MLLERCILTHGKLGHLAQIEGRFLNDVYHYSFIQYFWFNCEVSTVEVGAPNSLASFTARAKGGKGWLGIKNFCELIRNYNGGYKLLCPHSQT